MSRGVGRSNVQMVVLTPGGRLLHAVTGYVSPQELLFELGQAQASWEAVKEAATTAEISVQRKALVVRQDEVQKGWREAFAPRGKNKQPIRGTSWQEHQAAHDREILRENPLVHAGNITTRMLTGGPGQHFGYGSGGSGEERQTPHANEIRRKLGAPPVRETEADKRRRERIEAARKARPGTPKRGGLARR